MTTKIAMTGAALALAAAGLFSSIPTPVVAEEAQTIHCYGINACKGKNDCMTAKNDCKGQGECKGQGFKLMTQTKCDEAGGKTSE